MPHPCGADLRSVCLASLGSEPTIRRRLDYEPRGIPVMELEAATSTLALELVLQLARLGEAKKLASPITRRLQQRPPDASPSKTCSCDMSRRPHSFFPRRPTISSRTALSRLEMTRFKRSGSSVNVRHRRPLLQSLLSSIRDEGQLL